MEPSPTKGHGDRHGHEVTDVVSRLQTDPRRGLTIEEAARRLAHDGPNRLPAPTRRSAWFRFLLQVHDVLIYMMLASSVIAGLLSHWIDAAVLFAAVVVNAVIGFIQERKAEEALDAIRNLLSLRTTVIRQAERIRIAVEDLVQGDLVTLALGGKVPADIRVVTAKNLFVNEAILTGESAVVEKSPTAVPTEAPLDDRRCLLYSGTLGSSGQGTGIVVRTGSRTKLGSISAMLEDVQEMTTPLVRQMDAFSRWLAAAIGIIAVGAFFIGVLWRGHSADDMFMMVVALAASNISEGLPAIMTLTLALGVRRMASRNVIVRHLPPVEPLGSVTVICSDKTGTLPKNEMTADLLVHGTRGTNPLRDLELGTTAERLRRTCRRPTLVVKRVAITAYEQVIVPVDFSPYSAPTLSMASRIAPHACISTVHAFRVSFEARLHIAGATDDTIQRYCDEQRQDAVWRIDQLIAECLPQAQRTACIVERGNLSSVILAQAQAADLIVTGKQGQSRAEELLLGNVTRHGLAGSSRNILVVSP